MAFPRSNVLVVLAILMLAGATAYWLYQDYQLERRAHREVLVTRAETIVTSLKAGIRSHRRLGNWLQENIDAVLREISSMEGVHGVAILSDTAGVVSSAGSFPAGLEPAASEQWTTAGLLVARRTQLVDPTDAAESPGRGRGRWAQADAETSSVFHQPVWIAVLIDSSDIAVAGKRSAMRFWISIAVVFGLVVASLFILRANWRHTRITSELQLAHERETRLEELTRLGAGLAHETKNPIGLIRALAQAWSADPEAPEERRRDAQLVVDEADRAVSRVNDFLAFARPKAPEIAEVDLHNVAEGTATLFRDEAHAKGIAIEVKVESAQVLADHSMLRQVLVNLIANSIAACDGHACRISVSSKPEPDQCWTLLVADSGRGIAAEDLPQVTKPYFSRYEHGTGLGLAIVDRIVKAHGWALTISSEVGAGTTVAISGIRAVAA